MYHNSRNLRIAFVHVFIIFICFLPTVFGQTADSLATQDSTMFEAEAPQAGPAQEPGQLDRELYRYKLDSLRLRYEERVQEVIDSVQTAAAAKVQKEKTTVNQDLENKYFGYEKLLKDEVTRKDQGFLGFKGNLEVIFPFQVEALNAYLEQFFPNGNSDYIQDFLIQIYTREADWVNAEHAILKFIYLYPESPIFGEVKKGRTNIFQTERYFKDKAEFLTNIIGAALMYKTIDIRYYKFLEMLRSFPDEAIRQKFIPEAHHFLTLYPQHANGAQVSMWLCEAYRQAGRPHSAYLTLQKLMIFYPDSREFAEALFRSAAIREENFGDYKPAIETYYRFLEKFGIHTLAELARYRIANIADVNLQDWEKAVNEYQIYADVYPNTDKSIPCLTRKAEILSDKMNLVEESAATYRSIVERYPDSMEARGALLKSGDLYVRFKKYDSAVQEYLSLFDKYPRDVKALVALEKAVDLYETKLANPEKTIVVLNYIVSNFPGTKEEARASKKLSKLAPAPSEPVLPVPQEGESGENAQ